jgi:hypothetical protein
VTIAPTGVSIQSATTAARSPTAWTTMPEACVSRDDYDDRFRDN